MSGTETRFHAFGILSRLVGMMGSQATISCQLVRTLSIVKLKLMLGRTFAGHGTMDANGILVLEFE
jgi:hypothetical protein